MTRRKKTIPMNRLQSHCLETLGLTESQYEDCIERAQLNGLQWKTIHASTGSRIMITPSQAKLILLDADLERAGIDRDDEFFWDTE